MIVGHTFALQIIFCDEGDKRDLLSEFFREMQRDDKVMVFVGQKCRADDISSDLSLVGIDCQGQAFS